MPDGLLQHMAELPAPRVRATRLPLDPSTAVRLAVSAVVFWAAYDGGLYSVGSWTALAIVVWWAVVLGLVLGLLPRGAPPRGAWITGSLLAAFAAFTGLSGFWAAGAEAPFQGMGRVLLYVGVLAFVLVTSGRGSLTAWSDGVALGIGAVAALALLSRLFPGALQHDKTALFLPGAHTRLSYPVNYWNGLAILTALAWPLFLRMAVAGRTTIVRAAALAPLPVIAATIYLASSRTGAITAVVGLVVFVALSGRRWPALGAAALSLVAAAATVLFVARQHKLVNGPLESSAAASQGHVAFVVVLALCVGVALVHAGLLRLLRGTPPIPSRVGWGATAVFAVVVVVALVLAHPVRRWNDFTKPPPVLAAGTYIENHFLSTNGNWRWQYWQSAVDEFKTRPLIGRGTGSYEAWWSARGRLVGFIGNAHSLYFETLGELGILGLLMLVASFGTGVLVAVRRALRAPPGIREAAAAVTAGFVAYAVAAGVDWMWELPAVSVVGVALLGLAVGPATTSAERTVAGPRFRRRFQFALGTFAVLALLVAADIYAADAKLQDSQAAAGRGDYAAAASAAGDARRLEPWAASPYTQLALVYESSGHIPKARTWITRALAHDNNDWRLWLISARLAVKAGDIPAARTSLDQARSLNPRSAIPTATG